MRRETPEPPLQEEGGAWKDAAALEKAKEKLEASFGLGRERMGALTPELENPAESRYLSADEILVRRQEVESAEKAAILTAGGMKTAFVTLLAYLLANDLLNGKSLDFFTD